MSTLVNRAGGQLVADQRVCRFGSHHQKLLVVHMPDRQIRCIAFIGGIDLSRAAATALTTTATTTRCGSTPGTAAGHPGTTCSWRCAARPCWTWT
jgi:sugar lactone lactonase YvrE